jgi:ubiquinone/menaquinone biosynthesis C-methylase UbiE
MPEPEIVKTLKDFWEPKDAQHAHDLILFGPDWKKYTDDIVPFFLNDEIKANIPEWGVALEIGCGVGRVMAAMSEHFDVVIGVDISEGMIRLSRDYLKLFKNAHAFLCDGTTINRVDDNSIDFIYSVICFQHLPERYMVQNYLAESRRVLKPGGLIRVQTHAGNPCKGFNGMEGHFYPTLDAFAQEFTDAGLVVIGKQKGLAHPEYLWVTAQRPA